MRAQHECDACTNALDNTSRCPKDGQHQWNVDELPLSYCTPLEMIILASSVEVLGPALSLD
jgi:hypothetical protein